MNNPAERRGTTSSRGGWRRAGLAKSWLLWNYGLGSSPLDAVATLLDLGEGDAKRLESGRGST